MGAIQQPTAAMGPYGTEIRKESFYLTVSAPTVTFYAQLHGDQGVRVPVSHAKHLLAALDQVTGHRGWREWNGTPSTGNVAVTPDGDHLVIVFDASVHEQKWADEEGADSSISTEVAYWDVADLRAQLAPYA